MEQSTIEQNPFSFKINCGQMHENSGFLTFFDKVYVEMKLFQHKRLFFVTYLPWIWVVTRLVVQLVTLFNRRKKRIFRNKNEGAIFWREAQFQFNLLLSSTYAVWMVYKCASCKKSCVGIFEMHGKSLVPIEMEKKCVLTWPAKISTLWEKCGQWKQTSVRNKINKKFMKT